MSKDEHTSPCEEHAVEGMLREYMRAGKGDDEQLVAKIMSALDMPNRQPLLLRLWPAWAAVFVLACGALFSIFRGQREVSPLPLAVIRSGKVEILRANKRILGAANTAVFPGDRATVKRLATIDTPCGSRVKIDNGSEVEFPPLAKSERVKITVLRGRAFCRVSKSPRKFIIDGLAHIEVKGTTFGVSRTSSKLDVSVYEGQVNVRSAGSELKLRKGQSASADGAAPPTRTTIDPNAALKWARDRVKFENAPIRDVLRWLEKNSRYQIETRASIRNDIRVSLEINNEDPAEVMDVISVCCGLHWEEEGNYLVLTE